MRNLFENNYLMLYLAKLWNKLQTNYNWCTALELNCSLGSFDFSRSEGQISIFSPAWKREFFSSFICLTFKLIPLRGASNWSGIQSLLSCCGLHLPNSWHVNEGSYCFLDRGPLEKKNTKKATFFDNEGCFHSYQKGGTFLVFIVLVSG